MKLNWVTKTINDGIGNAYGYTVHNNTLRSFVEKRGDVEFSDDADIALHITPPETFYPVEGKVNFLFTMFEGLDIPDLYRNGLVKADYLLVPSSWVKGLFAQVFPEDRIFVVSHGVEPTFRYVERRFPKGKKFRFLWVGAPNPRKGWEDITFSWVYSRFAQNPNVELYVKTTRLGNLERKGNVILDSRNIPRKRLIELYHSAHCFLFPTRGEGFGLTLAEAMRTGLPCISPYYSGLTDFFDEKVGYTIDYEIKDTKMIFIGRQQEGEVPSRAAFPIVAQLAEKMYYVLGNYKEALEKGKEAHKRIRDNFTWEKSAQALVDALKKGEEND